MTVFLCRLIVHIKAQCDAHWYGPRCNVYCPGANFDATRNACALPTTHRPPANFPSPRPPQNRPTVPNGRTTQTPVSDLGNGIIHHKPVVDDTNDNGGANVSWFVSYAHTGEPFYDMTTSWYGISSRITGPLWGESTGKRWIPLTKGPVIFWCSFVVSLNRLLNT